LVDRRESLDVRTLLALLVLGAVMATVVWTAALPPSAVALRARGSSTVSPGPFPKTATDPLGRTVTLRAAPTRIVSLALSADEILLELVPPERLAGLTVFVDDPSTSVASAHAPKSAQRVTGEPEGLLTLEPDLVIASAYTRPEALTLVEGAGIPVIGTGSHATFDDVLAAVITLGDAVGEPEKARALAAATRARIDAVASRPRLDRRRKRVLVWDGGYTYGRGTLEDDMVRLAGGENAASSLNGAAGLTEEAAVTFAPDVIIVPVEGADVVRNAPRLVGESPVWSAVGAVGRGEVYGVPRAWIGCVSHHAVRALEAVGRILDSGGT
jgi:iron complex transport system substrate-binding protein